jgi:hypothetical protein
VAALGLWRRPAVVIPMEHGNALRVNVLQAHRAALVRDDDAADGWALVCEHLPEPRSHITTVRGPAELPRRLVLTGASARAAVSFLLPHLNRIGGDPETVEEATHWLLAVGGAAGAGGPDRAFRTIAESLHVRPALRADRPSLVALYEPVRLALEMAVHEEEERRHLAGELSVLAWRWRRAEYLASIADGLGLPQWLEERLGRIREGRPPVARHARQSQEAVP